MPVDSQAFELSSVQLFDRARGNIDISDEMIAHYLPSLRAFIRARLSDDLRRRESESDIVQSVCRGLIQDRDKLNFAAEAQFRAWLFTNALNTIYDKARYWDRARRASNAEESLGEGRRLEDLSQGYSGVFSPSRIAGAREQLVKLEEAFDKLPEHYAEIISLARIARLPHEEIAKQMGRSVGATRQLLGRALRQLSSELKKLGGETGA
ncbi:MAG: hypothetical protein CSA62_13050 [Planctomycetota bacterium]|nr:MAG: hypothetical protein CSA62_13050 [Planctomycetota bacterium]